MKKIWTFKKHFIVSLFIGLFIGLYNKLFMGNDGAIVGIIGGADGPTAVFVASSKEEITNIMKLIILLTREGIFNGIIGFIICLGLYKPVQIGIEKMIRR